MNVRLSVIYLLLPGVLETDLAGVLLGVERGVEAAESNAGGRRNL